MQKPRLQKPRLQDSGAESRHIYESADHRDFDFPWEEDDQIDAARRGETSVKTDVKAPSFPTRQVYRESYGLVQEGREDINPTLYPGLPFNAQGELLPPASWG